MNKVLIIDLAKNYGGIEVRVMQMAENMHDKRHYIVMVYNGSPLHNYLKNKNLNVISSPYKRSSIKNIFFIKKIIKEYSIDVVDTHNAQSQLWGILGATLAGLRNRIMTLHIAYSESELAWRKYVYTWIIKLNALLSARFIAISKHLESYIRNLGIKNEILVSENGIDTEKYRNISGDEFRRNIGISDEKKIILNLGRLEPVKGQKYLIDAMKIIRNNNSDAVCVIAGTGRLENKLKEQVEQEGLNDCILMPGFVEETEKALAACDIFCLPSLEEGLPYALLEACAAGKPSIATGVGGVRDFLNNSKAGIIIKPENVEELADKLDFLLNNKHERTVLGNNGLKYVTNNCGIKDMVNETIQFYDKI